MPKGGSEKPRYEGGGGLFAALPAPNIAPQLRAGVAHGLHGVRREHRRPMPAGGRYEMQRVRQDQLWMRQGRQVQLREGLRLREEKDLNQGCE